MTNEYDAREDLRSRIVGAVEEAFDGKADQDVVVACVMCAIDDFVDDRAKEVANDDSPSPGMKRGYSICNDDVYEGMRIRMTYNHSRSIPSGATGTVVIPDKDGAPGVNIDPPWEKNDSVNFLTRPDVSAGYQFIDVDKMEDISDE